MKKLGFTLAEVLITLGIIGVVAAMTIPTLMQQHEEKVNIVKFKKFYSAFSQAIMLARPENGDVREWSANTNKLEAAKDWINILKPHLKIVKECTVTNDNCFASSYKKLSGANDSMNSLENSTSRATVNFVLADGTSVKLALYSNNCSYGGSICANVYVDINGQAKPNVYGRDTFGFTVYADNKILPLGDPLRFSSYEQADTTCLPSNASGTDCAAWVLRNNNMDYLHCPTELSWVGKHSCK